MFNEHRIPQPSSSWAPVCPSPYLRYQEPFAVKCTCFSPQGTVGFLPSKFPPRKRPVTSSSSKSNGMCSWKRFEIWLSRTLLHRRSPQPFELSLHCRGCSLRSAGGGGGEKEREKRPMSSRLHHLWNRFSCLCFTSSTKGGNNRGVDSYLRPGSVVVCRVVLRKVYVLYSSTWGHLCLLHL